METDKLEALHYHAKAGNYSEVQDLLNEGLDPDGKNLYGTTPLMMAAGNSRPEIVELLINSSADVHCWDKRRWTALHHASLRGSVAIVRCLIDKGVIVDMKDSFGITPLMLAVHKSHDVVELLINSGADIHCCDNSGCTALHGASLKGSVAIARLLVHKGVDVNKKNRRGKTPLMRAAQGSNVDQALAVFELLVDSGADIHCCDNNGWTALHHASHKGSVKIAQFLVNKEDAVNKKNYNGETPLMLAAQEKKVKVVELLINTGADIHCCGDDGWTVLHHASCGGLVTIVRYLVDKGVVLDTKNREGETPLFTAVSFGEVEAAEYLLKAGADSNLEDNKGVSPFNYLIKKNRSKVELIKLFIEKGAYVKSTDYDILLEDPLLKISILQDVKLCSRAAINKFDNKDLPVLYKGFASAQTLPHIDQMKMGNRSGMVLEVERAVTHEIQANGFCNLFKMTPLVLGTLCVKSLEKSGLAFNQANSAASQHGSKRLGDYTKQDNPCKKLRIKKI